MLEMIEDSGYFKRFVSFLNVVQDYVRGIQCDI